MHQSQQTNRRYEDNIIIQQIYPTMLKLMQRKVSAKFSGQIALEIVSTKKQYIPNWQVEMTNAIQ